MILPPFDEDANAHRKVGNLFDVKLRAIEHLHRAGIDIALVVTIVRTVKDLVPQESYIDPHAHTCDSEFLFIGDNDDLTGLTAQVWLGDETFVIESPAAVFIPKDVVHNVKLVSGSGKFINIVLHPEYDNALHPQAK